MFYQLYKLHVNLFRSKEISKSSVVDDMVKSNQILYPEAKNPDHVIVIKYVPFVNDSKRAMDEYICSIFMGGHQTFLINNTCEDSLLAAPLIFDLAIITELCSRISVSQKVNFLSLRENILVRDRKRNQWRIQEIRIGSITFKYNA